MTAIGAEERWHLQFAQRWVGQYNFYGNDQRWGRMFVRMLICPFSTCVPQSAPLAGERDALEGIDFEQRSNAFLKCSHPRSLREGRFLDRP